jgi:hypothetical protein
VGTKQPVGRFQLNCPEPEDAMSDPSSTDPVRRINLQAVNAAGATWTTLWTWFAAIAAAAFVLALAFGYDRSDLAGNYSRAPATTGSATGSVPPTPAGDR